MLISLMLFTLVLMLLLVPIVCLSLFGIRRCLLQARIVNPTPAERWAAYKAKEVDSYNG